MPDRLREIIFLQNNLMRRLKVSIKDLAINPGAIDNTMIVCCIAIIEEVTEILRYLPWKPWQRNKPDLAYDRGALKDEIVDLLHFVLEIAILTGMDDEEIYRAYKKKNEINLQRAERETDTSDRSKVS